MKVLIAAIAAVVVPRRRSPWPRTPAPRPRDLPACRRQAGIPADM